MGWRDLETVEFYDAVSLLSLSFSVVCLLVCLLSQGLMWSRLISEWPSHDDLECLTLLLLPAEVWRAGIADEGHHAPQFINGED